MSNGTETPTISPPPADQQPAFAANPPPAETLSPFAWPGAPWENDSAFIAALQLWGYACPGSNVGDYAFLNWLYQFSGAYKGGTTPPAPTISALNPNTGPANTDATVEITGTGFDPATVQVQVGASLLTPNPNPTATDLVVLIPAADLATAGPVAISVKNGDGQVSGTLDFTVT